MGTEAVSPLRQRMIEDMSARKLNRSGSTPHDAVGPADTEPFRPSLSLVPGPQRWLTLNDGLPRPRQPPIEHRTPLVLAHPSAAIGSLGIPRQPLRWRRRTITIPFPVPKSP
jgi:hypothetical protein